MIKLLYYNLKISENILFTNLALSKLEMCPAFSTTIYFEFLFNLLISKLSFGGLGSSSFPTIKYNGELIFGITLSLLSLPNIALII